MEDILTRFPNLKAAFIQNEDMTLGAIEVIKDQGADVVIVTQNGTPAGLEAVANGEIAATVGWSPSEEATMALSRLVEYIQTGVEPQPKKCQTPMVVISAENVDEAHPWVPTEESTKNAIVAVCGNE
jgi:ABC-type sugar transport system substrate-binding protein